MEFGSERKCEVRPTHLGGSKSLVYKEYYCLGSSLTSWRGKTWPEFHYYSKLNFQLHKLLIYGLKDDMSCKFLKKFSNKSLTNDKS